MLTFGVEIECMVPFADRVRVARELVAAGVPCRDVGRYHTGLDREGWKMESDASLTAEAGMSTFELISPPMVEGPGSFEIIEKVCRVLDACEARVNRSCGLHVHVGLEGAPVTAIRKLAVMYVEHEALIDQLIPPSRRGNANNYCRSVAATAQMSRLSNATTIRDISSALTQDQKHYKLHLSSYWRYSTVQFRHHSGTVDANKIIKWVTFCCKMVEAANRDANQPVVIAALPRPDSNTHSYWHKGRRSRLLFGMLSRPEGATGEECRVALGIATRPCLTADLRKANASVTPVGRRGGFQVFRLGHTAQAVAPTATSTAATTLADLYDKLGLDDTDKEFWRERQVLLSRNPLRQPRRAVA